MGNDRYDMDGITNQFWWFYYKDILYYISCDYAISEYIKVHTNHYFMDIVNIATLNNDITNKKNVSLQELTVNSDEFIKELENAFNTYQGDKYNFNFKFNL